MNPVRIIQFAGEVFKKTAGMSRARANDIANRLLPLYEAQLGQAPYLAWSLEAHDVPPQVGHVTSQGASGQPSP